ncbi:hypothetical protein NP233_g7357 [Leucocoprinus birnbaumii]|uniref:Uncharacterized protein n=1 Tax=Leucocoprinus birnbaumii TaxID=56174 RepID=A0AAD5YUU2_9AGAR|nr:hypothetical protein NP233_g7357 [Leucocoprinus birnbaumii]
MANGRGRSKTRGYTKQSTPNRYIKAYRDSGLTYAMECLLHHVPCSHCFLADSDQAIHRRRMDPGTPSGFALHAVFIRFIAVAEYKVKNLLRAPPGSFLLVHTEALP